ncbi:MAG: electron transfer flavoprotein subunit beta/FixA family protein [Rhodothermales bacterium]|nr:electron transfer flavoprotein subunit beta/FixA family protein [Rhodothermales bacterium]
MRFAVCIKQVPDVAAPVQIRDGALVFDTGRLVLNAYDASAVEAALVLTETHGGEIDLVCVGPEKARETIRKALAMGAHRATHLVTDDAAVLDSGATAALLARHFEAHGGYDAILCGKQSQDTDAGLTGAMLAAHLGLPYATNAVGLEQEGDTLVVTRQGDAGQEIIALPAPCLVTCSNDMNDPRIPNIKGIMQSKRKPMETEPAEVPGARTRVVAYEPMPEREAGPQFEGEPDELARTLADRLTNEAKVL